MSSSRRTWNVCRRLPPTPSPWASGEFVESSPEDEVQSTRNRKWRDNVGGGGRRRTSSRHERRSMLRKLIGRLSHKIKPHVEMTPTAARVPSHGVLRQNSAWVGVIHETNCRGRLACQHHRFNHQRHHHEHACTTLSIYRRSLQSCVTDTALDRHITNNHCGQTVHSIYQKSNQVRINTIKLQINLDWFGVAIGRVRVKFSNVCLTVANSCINTKVKLNYVILNL